MGQTLLYKLLVVFSIICSSIAPIRGAAQENKDWLEIRSENFNIRSSLDQEESIELAYHLELFRAAVTILTNTRELETSVPNELYVFDSGLDLYKLTENRNIAGLFRSGLRNNLILMSERRGMRESQVILHEYVHYLMRNNGSFRYPYWYSEGLAEFLGASEYVDGKFNVGLFLQSRVNSLRAADRVHLRSVLDPNKWNWRTDDISIYYAKSWALVHYLQTHPTHSSEFPSSFLAYSKLMEDGADPVEAFEESFAMDVDELEDTILNYIEDNQFRYFPFDAKLLLPDFEPEIAKMSKAQISLDLGRLGIQFGRYDIAEDWYSIALEDEATRPRAEAGLGNILKFQGEIEEALPHLERAISLDDQDPYLHIDTARYWYTLARRELKPEYLENARRHFVKAANIDSSIPEIYAMYGLTYMLDGEDHSRAVAMFEEAAYLLPSEISIRNNLALAYMKVGNTAEALREAKWLLAWSHPESASARRALEIIEEIESETTEH